MPVSFNIASPTWYPFVMIPDADSPVGIVTYHMPDPYVVVDPIVITPRRCPTDPYRRNAPKIVPFPNDGFDSDPYHDGTYCSHGAHEAVDR